MQTSLQTSAFVFLSSSMEAGTHFPDSLTYAFALSPAPSPKPHPSHYFHGISFRSSHCSVRLKIRPSRDRNSTPTISLVVIIRFP